MLFYVVSKYAKYQDNVDDVAVAIRYIPNNNTERKMSEYKLSKEKCDFIAELMGIPSMFLIPISREKYIEMQDETAEKDINEMLDDKEKTKNAENN